jgi:hypothetical protein
MNYHAAATIPGRVCTDIYLPKQYYKDCCHFYSRTPDPTKSVVLTAVPSLEAHQTT